MRTYTYDLRDNVKTVTEAQVGGGASRVTKNYYDLLDRKIAVDGPDADTLNLGVSTYWSYNADGTVESQLVFAGDVNQENLTDGQITKDEIDAMRSKVWRRLAAGDKNCVALQTNYQYDNLQRVVASNTSTGVRTTYQYDQLGNVVEAAVSFIDPAILRKLPATAWAQGAARTLTTTTWYDAFSRPYRVFGPAGADGRRPEQVAIYNADGTVKKQHVKNPNCARGWTTTAFEYDGAGRVCKTTVDDDTALKKKVSTLSYSDAVDHVIRTVDAFNLKTDTTYDASGHVTRQAVERPLVWVPDGTTGAELPGYYATVDYLYNKDGSVREQKTGQLAPGGTSWTQTAEPVTYAYDNLGRVVAQEQSVVQQKTTKTRFGYNVFGVRDWVKDADDNITELTVDTLGRTTAESAGGTRTYKYDSFGNLLESTDRNSKTIRYTNDVHGRRVKEEWVGDSYVATYQYTPLGELLDAKDNQSRYSYTYDSARRLREETQLLAPLGANLGAANPASDPKAVDFVYGSDFLGEVRTVKGTINADHTADFLNLYCYNNRGMVNAVWQTHAPDQTASTVRGKEVLFKRYYTSLTDTHTAVYATQTQRSELLSRDPLTGKLVIALTGSTHELDYGNGQASLIQHYLGSVPEGSSNGVVVDTISKTGYSYDSRGLLTHEVENHYTTESRRKLLTTTKDNSYDSAGQLTAITTIPTEGPDKAVTQPFSYDANGNPAGDGIAVGPRNELLKNEDGWYLYDAEGNLTARELWATTATPMPRVSGGFSNDQVVLSPAWLYRLDLGGLQFSDTAPLDAVQEPTNVELEFTVTACDNGATRTLKTGNVTANRTYYHVPGSEYSPGISEYCYRVSGLQTVLFNTGDDQFTAGIAGEASITFKTEDGSLFAKVRGFCSLTKLVVDKFTWDYRNRLKATEHVTGGASSGEPLSNVDNITVRPAAGVVRSNAYDVFNNRISADRDRFVYLGGNPAMEFTETATGDPVSSQHRCYMPGTDTLLSVQSGSAIDWTLTDQQGTVRAVRRWGTPSSVSIVTYDAWGRPTKESLLPASVNAIHTFSAGRDYDRQTNLYYNRARYYDPFSHRFISQDPIGFAGGDANLYRYCGNSPANATDPSGQEPVTLAVCGITALVLGLIGREALYHAAATYDSTAEIYAKPNWTQADVAELNARLSSAQRWHTTGNVLGGAAVAVAAAPVVIPTAAAALWGGGTVSAGGAYTLATAGYVAGTVQGSLSTIAAGPNAGVMGLFAPALGGLGGAFVPYGAFGGLGLGLGVGGAEWLGGGNFLGRGYQIGSLIGGIAGGGAQFGWAGAAWEGGGALAFGGTAYALTRDIDQALFWANVGQFAGGAASAFYRFPVPRPPIRNAAGRLIDPATGRFVATPPPSLLRRLLRVVYDDRPWNVVRAERNAGLVTAIGRDWTWEHFLIKQWQIARYPSLRGIGNSYLNTFLRITRSENSRIGASLAADLLFKTRVIGGSVAAGFGGYSLGGAIYDWLVEPRR